MLRKIFISFFIMTYITGGMAAWSIAEGAPSGDSASAVPVIRYNFKVALLPDEHRIQVEAVVDVKELILEKGNQLEFLLHKNLRPIAGDIKLEERPVAKDTDPLFRTYRMVLRGSDTLLHISYSGKIDDGRKQSSGTISGRGVALMGTTYWYPVFKGALSTFKLEVASPEKWVSVSQGERLRNTKNDSHNLSIWWVNKPQESIYLIANKYKEYTLRKNGRSAQVYLRDLGNDSSHEEDAKLAQNYLDATHRYIDLYSNMFGAYPYKKFALLENFWETGLGMPSFTLLGPTVIRLPFIIYSSYPHEILHNWWGNSVYVDYDSGNWCEGLTTYFADHLFQEMRGKGYLYRRSALKRFSDYVTSSKKDFPLRKFHERHNSSSQAVGYDKGMMFFHMLKIYLGEEIFMEGMAHFYKENIFKIASFEDIKASLEAVSGRSLTAFFDQWVERIGSAELALNSPELSREGGGYEVSFTLEQKQKAKAFDLTIPVEVKFTDGSVDRRLLDLAAKKSQFALQFIKEPKEIKVDPKYDVFRSIYPEEVPPTLSEVLSEDGKVVFVVPKSLPADLMKAYNVFIKEITKVHFSSYRVMNDEDFLKSNVTESVWLLGWGNKGIEKLSKSFKDYGVTVRDHSIKAKDLNVDRSVNAALLTFRLNGDSKKSIVWVVGQEPDIWSVLARKIPHYGKYSYLNFDFSGKNLSKSQWPSIGSPLNAKF